ncbi:MAG: flagellar assembly protein FliH [Gammaproteobacteria bacterium]|nr:flagellar assembly protein FliH [Gammaproteobacteria bacterium]MDH5659657.1 flagellar assembly protein FliH [Gammaproteobacteria bacterium]
MTTSKVLLSNDLTAYERWELPLVSGNVVSATPTAEELVSIQKEAYNEGFELGRKEGLQHKKQEIEDYISSLRSIIQLMSEPLKDLDNEVVSQMAQLSMIVAKQVVRREIHTDEGEIVGIVREAMSALPVSTRKIILNIHPDDSELIRNAFSLGEDDSDELRWKITEDPMISRGGCKISSENSTIDATVESRLNRTINTLLGSERESDE